MSAPYHYALATTVAGLTTALSPGPYQPKPIGRRKIIALDGTVRRSGKEGRELQFPILDSSEFKALWDVAGGDDADSAQGFIRCKMIKATGLTELWGDYSCTIEKPVENFYWEGANLRRGVMVRVTQMQLNNLSSTNDP